jgi:hypothetical protein
MGENDLSNPTIYYSILHRIGEQYPYVVAVGRTQREADLKADYHIPGTLGLDRAITSTKWGAKRARKKLCKKYRVWIREPKPYILESGPC